MRLSFTAALWLAASTPFAVSATAAETPHQMLTDAAFEARDKDGALARIAQADNAATALIARNPGDKDAVFVKAMALGYRAKLTRSRSKALAARRQFEQLAAADPRDAEAAAAVGTWHLDSVIDLGGMVAGMAIGAKKATGFTMMDRSVVLGGKRAMYPGLAALLRLAIDPADPRGRALAEMASNGSIATPLDRIMQGNSTAVLQKLRAGDLAAVQALARQSLPFGRVNR